MGNTGQCIGYLRRSRVDDARPGAVSYDGQLAAVRDIAKRNGCTDPEILEDWGRSGGGGKEHLRPRYRTLRDRIDSGAVSDVVSYDLSRLTRSLERYGILTEVSRS